MTLFHNRTLSRWGYIFFLLSLLYAVFSYSLTDPNLTLSTWPVYWQFQQWAWQTFFHHAPLMTAVYCVLVGAFFIVYGLGLRSLTAHSKSPPLDFRNAFVSLVICFSPLLLSYNALSHDVFNYIFNAKMILIYQANPHIQTALDFAYDPWTRFMHNTHTPAPYGYGWTALSLLPSLLGAGKFTITWLLFRVLALGSVAFTIWSLQKLVLTATGKPLTLRAFWLVFCNPLLILEVFSNQHNDLWMMAPALWSCALLLGASGKPQLKRIVGSALLLAFSVSIKWATLTIIPVWLVMAVRYWIPSRRLLGRSTLLFLASLSLFAPLFTARSQQFLPWYLLWALVWIPLVKAQWWQTLLVAFSATALLRYAPWLWAGEFTNTVLLHQKYLLWGGALGAWALWQGWQHFRRVR